MPSTDTPVHQHAGTPIAPSAHRMPSGVDASAGTQRTRSASQIAAEALCGGGSRGQAVFVPGAIRRRAVCLSIAVPPLAGEPPTAVAHFQRKRAPVWGVRGRAGFEPPARQLLRLGFVHHAVHIPNVRVHTLHNPILVACGEIPAVATALRSKPHEGAADVSLRAPQGLRQRGKRNTSSRSVHVAVQLVDTTAEGTDATAAAHSMDANAHTSAAAATARARAIVTRLLVSCEQVDATRPLQASCKHDTNMRIARQGSTPVERRTWQPNTVQMVGYRNGPRGESSWNVKKGLVLQQRHTYSHLSPGATVL